MSSNERKRRLPLKKVKRFGDWLENMNVLCYELSLCIAEALELEIIEDGVQYTSY